MENKRKTPVWKWILGIIAVLCIAGVGAYFFLKKDLSKPPQQSVVKPILSDEIKKMVVRGSDSLYRLEFSYFDINVDSGKMIIRDMNLIPDSAIYHKLVLLKKAPNSVLKVRMDSVVITHFAFEKTGDGRKLVIDNMILQNPAITINHKLLPYSDSINIKEEKTLLSTMKELMKTSSTKKITINNLNLTMINHNDKQTCTTSLRNLNIVTNEFNVTTAKATDSSKEEHTSFTIQSSRITTPDSLYYLISEDIRLTPEMQSLFIKKAELKPRLNKTAFFKAVKFRKDYFHFIQYDNLCKGLDIDRLLRKQQIYIRSFTVGSSWGEIYTNNNYPKRNPPVRNHSDPHERLQKLAFDITIDTMNMHNGTTLYAVKAEKTDESAVMKIDNAESVITNITNNTEAKKRNHFTTCNMTARVMEAGQMKSTIRFNLTDKDGAFTITNTLGPMDGKVMNVFMKPFAQMEVQSLDIQKMITTIHGNAYGGKGNIDFYYKDMKVAFVKKKDDDTYKKQKLISFVSNLFVPDDNPNKRGKFKKGPIDVKRDPRDSFFGFLAKCNIKGMAIHISGLDKE